MIQVAPTEQAASHTDISVLPEETPSAIVSISSEDLTSSKPEAQVRSSVTLLGEEPQPVTDVMAAVIGEEVAGNRSEANSAVVTGIGSMASPSEEGTTGAVGDTAHHEVAVTKDPTATEEVVPEDGADGAVGGSPEIPEDEANSSVELQPSNGISDETLKRIASLMGEKLGISIKYLNLPLLRDVSDHLLRELPLQSLEPAAAQQEVEKIFQDNEQLQESLIELYRQVLYQRAFKQRYEELQVKGEYSEDYLEREAHVYATGQLEQGYVRNQKMKKGFDVDTEELGDNALGALSLIINGLIPALIAEFSQGNRRPR